MNTDKTYNGWTNYETWAIALWLDNDEQSQGYWREQASFLVSESGLAAHRPRTVASFTDAEVASYALAEQLKENHEQALPEIQGFASDLLNAAMSEVNWHEIAKAFVAEAVQDANFKPLNL